MPATQPQGCTYSKSSSQQEMGVITRGGQHGISGDVNQSHAAAWDERDVALSESGYPHDHHLDAGR